jgi:hypothetical protein
MPIQLSPELAALLAAGIGFLVTAGLKDLGSRIGVDFTSLASGITGAIVTAAVFFANNLLAMVPAQLQPVAVALMPALVAVFAAYGIHGTAKSLRPI